MLPPRLNILYHKTLKSQVGYMGRIIPTTKKATVPRGSASYRAAL